VITNKKGMKRSTKYRMILMLMTAGVFQGGIAQIDPHFSQYYVYPSYLNPALTGAFAGQYRVAGIFRNQWSNVGSAYSTKGISSDFTTDKNIGSSTKLNNKKLKVAF
jgi:hypothetical protein